MSSPVTLPLPSEYRSAVRLAKPRAAMIAYRWVNQQPHFLLISSRKNPQKLTLPGGKVARHESPVQAAIRECREESGVLTDAPSELGNYLHRKAGHRLHPTRTYLAPLLGQLSDREQRSVHWLSIDQVLASPFLIRRSIQSQIGLAADELLRRAYAA